MYLILLVALVAASLLLIRNGQVKRLRNRVVAGAALLLGTGLFFSLLGFWGEMLWFEALGFERRFWVEVGSQAGRSGESARRASGSPTRARTPKRNVRTWCCETVTIAVGAH